MVLALKKSQVANNSISLLSNAFILVYLMGWVGAGGFLLLFLNFLLFVCAYKCAEREEVALGERRDERVKKSMEMFEMIKYIKVSALESYFCKKLLQLR